MKYSFIGSLFSIPLWFLGKIWGTPSFWCARYNFFIFVTGLITIWWILKDHVPRKILVHFILIMTVCSMFPYHQRFNYGEMFSAITMALGLALFSTDRKKIGSLMLILSTANTPASLPALIAVSVLLCLCSQKWRYMLVPALALVCILTESYIKFGSFFHTGYENDAGYKTIMPFSGMTGFSYPFFLGIISILFSFGKGLLFFAPGLFLPVRKYIPDNKPLTIFYISSVIYTIVLIIVYSKWWAWYGGWFWGPRFFLYASVPASLAISVLLARASSIPSLFGCSLALLMSTWCGICGMVYMECDLAPICQSNKYFFEFLNWYVPEYSVLFRPFVVAIPLSSQQIILLVYAILVFIYLAYPVLKKLNELFYSEYINLKIQDMKI